MQFQKITLALAAVAAVLACTGTHEASAGNTTPVPTPESVSGQAVNAIDASMSTPARAIADRADRPPANVPARATADTDTTVRRHVVVGDHPTPPVLDSLIKGTLPVRGLYVFRFGANNRRLQHQIGRADSTEINALIIDVKDEFGLNYESTDPMVKKSGGTQVKAHNLRALVAM